MNTKNKPKKPKTRKPRVRGFKYILKTPKRGGNLITVAEPLVDLFGSLFI